MRKNSLLIKTDFMKNVSFVIACIPLLFFFSCVKADKTKIGFGELEVLIDAPYFFEAPTYDSEFDLIYFTGYKDKKEGIYRFFKGEMISVPDTGGIGGTYIAPDGYFYATNAKDHQLLRYTRNSTGLINKEILFTSTDFHQPNDLCVSSKGLVYFTDPDFKNKKTGGVYVWSKLKGVKKLLTHLPCPNGVMLTKDEKRVIISDSHLKEWKIYDIDGDGQLVNEKLFFKPETKNTNSPDGMSRDRKGRLYLTGLGGVWVVDDHARVLGFKPIHEFCSNVFVYENSRGKSMVISCSKKVYQTNIVD